MKLVYFGSIEEDEYDYDYILIDDRNTQDDEKEDCGVEGTIQIHAMMISYRLKGCSHYL